MAEEYKLHIRTTADASGAELTQEALGEVAQQLDKVVDDATKGDRALGQVGAKLKQLSPEQIKRVEAELQRMIAAEEEAGRDAAKLRAQLEAVGAVNLDKTSRGLGSMFSTFTAAGLATQAVTSLTSAIQNHIRSAIEMADRLGDLADRSGSTSVALQTIANTASLSGGSLENVGAALSKLTLNAQNAAEGSKPLTAAFTRLGITSADLKSLSPDDLFYKIADAVKSSSDRGRTYADVIDVMGRSSAELFNTLEQGGAEIRKTGEAMGVFGDETVRALKEAKDALGTFQNQLTIVAGKSIAFLGEWKAAATEFYADVYSRVLGVTSEELTKFHQSETLMLQAAEEGRKKLKAQAEEIDKVGDAATDAAAEIDKLDRAFRDRARARLPLSEQLAELRQEITDLRAFAAVELPGLEFENADALFQLSKMSGLSSEVRTRVQQLALQYAGLEDKVKQVGDADQKAQPDRLKRLDEIRVELAKPNVPIGKRNELLREELKLLGDVRKAAEDRAKAEAGPQAPAGPPKPISKPEDLSRQLDALERKSSRDPGLDALQAKSDALVKASQAELATAINQIPIAVGEIQTVAAKGLDEIHVALQLVPAAFTESVAPVKQAVVDANGNMTGEIQEVGRVILELGGTVSAGFKGIGQQVQGVNANLQRQINAQNQQIAALWRATK